MPSADQRHERTHVEDFVASFVAYAVEKRISKRPAKFGNGAIEGVASPEASTHAAVQGDFIPTTSLGIPLGAKAHAGACAWSIEISGYRSVYRPRMDCSASSADTRSGTRHDERQTATHWLQRGF
ncbi:tripartite tricarboxylate transporter permease [Bradyrhizobium manausense]|nr:tripartite tricarboxylate transporter permease [Bradyrhizobium manausense]